MKFLYIFFTILAVLVAFLFLDRIWFGIIDMVYFWKILVTLGIVGALVTAVYFIRVEFIEDKKLKKDKYVD